MDRKKLYRINEFARKCQVSVRTLKYYEELGLIKPAHTGDNGYRYYSLDQVDHVSTIILYQSYGFSLAEIKGFISKSDLDSHYSNLLTQQRIVEDDLRSLQNKKELIEYSLQFIDAFRKRPNEVYEDNVDVRMISEPIIRESGETIYINYMSDGFRSGGILDGDSCEVKAMFHVRSDGDIILKGKCLMMYSDRNSSHWKEMVREIRDHAIRNNLPVSDIYFEGLIENYETSTFLNKCFMMIKEGEVNENKK